MVYSMLQRSTSADCADRLLTVVLDEDKNKSQQVVQPGQPGVAAVNGRELVGYGVCGQPVN